jgi:hypothetical protein
VPYLRRTEEADAETVESARFKTLGRSVGIAGEYGAGEVRAQPLHGAHGAPEHALAAAAVIRVRVEEPRRGRGLTSEAEDAPERGGEERGDGGEEAGQDRHGGAPASLVLWVRGGGLGGVDSAFWAFDEDGWLMGRVRAQRLLNPRKRTNKCIF